MDPAYLLTTANQIPSASINTACEYIEKSKRLIARINELMLERSDIENLIGKDNISMMKDNHTNHVRFISSILKYYNAEVLVNTVLWVYKAYPSRGFSDKYWATQLNVWMTILKEELSESGYKEVIPIYEWMQKNIPTFVQLAKEDTNQPIS